MRRTTWTQCVDPKRRIPFGEKEEGSKREMMMMMTKAEAMEECDKSRWGSWRTVPERWPS